MRRKWTNELLANVALKYHTFKEFTKGDYGALQAAYKRNILDEITSHYLDSKSRTIFS